MSEPLLDPQLEAFYAQDPANFLERGPIAEPLDPATPPHTRVALELAAAFLVTRGLASRFLAGQDPRLGEVPVVAGQAWRRHAPIWLRLALPAIRQAYALGETDGLSDAELQEMSTEYAQGLGDYLNQTSAEALTQGFTQQLNGRWNEQLAWQRSSAAYGLDKEQMRSYVGALLRSEQAPGVDPVPVAGRLLAERLLVGRAERMGEVEGWRATQSGQAIAWMILQQRGELPADALREWDNRNEQACATCQALHGQRVALSEPFIHPVTKAQLWAPGAHPNCKCEVVLLLRRQTSVEHQALDGLSKRLGEDPYDRDKKGRFAATEHRAGKPTVHRERDPVVDEILAQVEQAVQDPFGVSRHAKDLFASPFTAPQHRFGKPQDLFRKPRDPFGVDLRSASLFDQAGQQRQGALKDRSQLKRVIHHVAVPLLLPGDAKQRNHEPYYLPAQELHNAFEESNGEVLWGPGDAIDFSEANANLANYSNYFDSSDGSPMSIYAVRADHPMMLLERDQPWISEANTDTAWAELLPALRHAQQQAIAHADDLVERLAAPELRNIFAMAGYDTREEPAVMRARIVRAVHAHDGGDDSLAGAYIDHLAWDEPELLGDQGVELARMIQELVGADVLIHGSEHNQFFVFENGFHDGSARHSAGHSVDLHDDYVAAHATYHSALMENGSGAEPFVVGWREISMVPADPHGKPLPRE